LATTLFATTYARVSGALLILVGVQGILALALGYIGFLSLDFLAWDQTHNVLHIVLGAVALYVGFSAKPAIDPILYGKAFGALYVVLAVLGFASPTLFGLGAAMGLHLELAENLLHLVLGGLGLVAGFYVLDVEPEGAWSGATATRAEPAYQADAPAADLAIGEVQFDAPGAEASNLREEWVEITNRGPITAGLAGWTLSDEANHVYTFPDHATLAPGASLRVRTGIGDDDAANLHWGRRAAVWNNTGDTAYLRSPDGALVAKKSWSPPAEPPKLAITATQFQPAGKSPRNLAEEYVQITNHDLMPVAMAGWTLRDAKRHVFKFPDGFRLAPGASVRVRTGIGKEGEEDLYWGRKAAVWNNDGDTATLQDAQGRTVATRSWKPEDEPPPPI
jgi:hypothetical protein